MATPFASTQDLRFQLYDVHDVLSLTAHPYFADHDREVFDMVIDTGNRIGEDLLRPVMHEMDQEQPELSDGVVSVHPAVRELMLQCGRGGWMVAHAPIDEGGQQVPETVMAAFRFLLAAANYPASVFPSLTMGAAELLRSFASPQVRDPYLGPMLEGRWGGTMALTEPHAGSSLADLATKAIPQPDGTFKIKGEKIFISNAEHDGVDNVVNLLLARISGAPAGSRGISLFAVPKLRVAADGSLVDNDVKCTAIYHKLGYKAAPLTQLALGEEEGCIGMLVGEPNRGLRYMFQMMNQARIEVGLCAAATASAAYQAALHYTRERTQGRAPAERDPHKPQVPIIDHADVKRMLLFQRAVVEGGLSLALQCSIYADRMHTTTGPERERYSMLLDLLTPAAKTWPSEWGTAAVSQGLQCLGGYGYCDEFPLEQYYRDVRIHSIHEGTTGIQALDLLGRKVVRNQGGALIAWLAELEVAIEAARNQDLGDLADDLAAARDTLQETTMCLSGLAMQGKVDLFLADATLYLELFGTVAVAWQWLLQATAARRGLESPDSGDSAFLQAKLSTAHYFFAYELPRIDGLARTLRQAGGLTLKPAAELFPA